MLLLNLFEREDSKIGKYPPLSREHRHLDAVSHPATLQAAWNISESQLSRDTGQNVLQPEPKKQPITLNSKP